MTTNDRSTSAQRLYDKVRSQRDKLASALRQTEEALAAFVEASSDPGVGALTALHVARAALAATENHDGN